MPCFLCLTLALLAAPHDDPPPPTGVSLATLLAELTDLDRLTRLPNTWYRTEQWSSFDRRSKGPEDEGWFANSDGFGGEPIPGFSAVLRPPGGDGVELYLIGEAAGPGAIVRTWSAGMGGVLRVYLDGGEAPLFEGAADAFLRSRSELLLAIGGVDVAPGDAFHQQDADYFPVPFASGLRMTWEGRLDELHFYQVQVRRFEAEARVAACVPERDVAEQADAIRAAIVRLVRPDQIAADVPARNFERELAPDAGEELFVAEAPPGGGAIERLTLRVESRNLADALRGVRLRIAFDGSERPQVEAPLGDFFGAGPGVHPYSSLPMTVEQDGAMTCRFVMPRAGGPIMTSTREPPSTCPSSSRSVRAGSLAPRCSS